MQGTILNFKTVPVEAIEEVKKQNYHSEVQNDQTLPVKVRGDKLRL
jgi:hypothetical protein